MLTVGALWMGLLGQAAALPPGHPDIPPMAHANPSAPGAAEFDPNQPLPPGHPSLPIADGGSPEAAMSAKELLDRLDKMKEQLKGRPKSAEIEFALGNLYYENSRWPDAIDAYRQLLERVEAPLARYRSLREKAHRTGVHPADCHLPGQPNFEAVIAAADEMAGRGEASKALACYELALIPMNVALTRQGNAWYLIGNEDKALEDHERALDLVPDSPDNLFFLGAILFEGGDGDLPRLERAKAYWQRFLKSDPDPEREKLVSHDILRLQMAIDNHGHLPAEMPPRMRAMAIGPIVPPGPAPKLSEAQQQTLTGAIARGEAALAGKHWQAASEAFASARNLDAGNVEAARGEGIALLNLGKFIEAEGALRDALGRDPDDSLALYELGEVFFENEHYTGAARFWSQVLEEDPKLAQQMGVLDKLHAAQQAQ